jgi:hypothetical protein
MSVNHFEKNKKTNGLIVNSYPLEMMMEKELKNDQMKISFHHVDDDVLFVFVYVLLL